MGFFKSKKVKKDSPPPQPKDSRRPAPQHRPPPPSPPTQVSHNWHPSSPYQQPEPFRPAGLLPPPPSRNDGAQPPPYHRHGPYPPIIVNQHHYYLGAPPPSQAPPRSYAASTPLGKLNLGSAVDLAKDVCQGTGQLLDNVLPAWHSYGSQLVSQGNGLVEGLSHRVCQGTCRLMDSVSPAWHSYGGQLVSQSNAVVDEISHRFDNVLTSIDQGGYNGKEHDIFAWQPAQTPTQPTSSGSPVIEKGLPKSSRKSHGKAHPKGQTTAAAAVVSGSFFAKVDHYANSRLPMNLPPLKLYIPTYPLLCLAAQYSERVYEPPTGRAERDAHVDADWRTGTKAMVIKSVPMDSMNTIVFAIRGTATFMDWAVNLDMTPTSPIGFLDDPGNLCHSGFLSVARKMIAPVARRLRQLLEEDPWRASYSLLITGHSAGGAVAALLYSHMLATSKDAESELNVVAGCFKRIHCVTFGTPPVSLVPLTKPDNPQLRKSVFLSFVNEGDPVTRADKAYVKSLLELFAAPTPWRVAATVGSSDGGRKSRKRGKPPSTTTTSTTSSRSKTAGPTWNVPPSTLSCAGRVVVLRSGDPKAARLRGKKTTVEERLHEGVVAQVVTDEQLRGVIWGDPVAHMMRLYAGRVEVLAVGAVTGRGY
ncbi:Alpha/Beta hydrolase protein [Parachaetomium inaequale]|uniref:Alpha/Beta hydrolase protein n=1 Tax=Parachaetomium inaequale TaxID=2588326 RepID=A0AAN6SRS3_9PEZI|nr:Alpha/Beta hydrolase protein [Parachaetomium inaequale]